MDKQSENKQETSVIPSYICLYQERKLTSSMSDGFTMLFKRITKQP